MKLMPDYYFKRVTDISPEFLRRAGVAGAAMDVDNTLAFDNENVLLPEVARWLGELKAAGIAAMALSNNSEKRGREFAGLCGLPYLARAQKPSGRSAGAVLEILGARPENVAVIGDQLFTDIAYGKRLGFVTILVERMGRDIPIFVKLKRVLERPIMRDIRKRGFTEI
jgi:HAD superfamily phosphatase (TIGR01668 family)